MTFALTKIQQPRPRPGLLLPRPAQEKALVSALTTHRAVLVCAPAGCGKTALLVRALAQLPQPHAVAWISLDPGDDLHRLLECLVAALEPFDPPWRTAPEGLIAAASRAGERQRQEVVDELVNTLEACDVAHGVVVLDDLHHVDDPACLAFLEQWLARLGPRWTMALAARHEPALRLARLRATGELADVRQPQLEFTRDEARALLAGAGLDAAAADALYERTGGWAAGLRLALNGARGGSAGSAIDRHAFDFFATEVLARIDPPLREFLLLTSVLHDLDPPRCAALSGDAHATRWLDEIQRLGLFAIVVDEAAGTLRLHDLFRDALKHRLRVERPDDWLALLQRAAAIEPDPVRRQSLLLAAQRPDDAAKALLAAGPRLITQGATSTLLRLVDAFPPAFADASAELQHVAGMAKWTVWEAQDAERRLARADALYTRRGDTPSALETRAQRSVTLIALGRLSEAGELIAPLRDQPLEVEVRIVTQGAMVWHALEGGATHAVAPRFEALVQVLETRLLLENWFYTVPAPRQTAVRGIGAALARWAAGALTVAGERPVPLRALALLTLGWRALWQARLDEAAELLQRAEADAQWTGQQVIARSHSLALRALLSLLRGDAEAALQAMRTRIAEHTAGYGDWGLWHTLFFASRVAAACGDVATLRDWMRRLVALQPALPDAGADRLRPLSGLQGTLAALEGRRDDALMHWREAIEHEEQADLLGQANEVRARLALELLQGGASREAAALVEPMTARSGDGPRGALFAAGVLRELARADWGSHLAAEHRATLARWAAALQPTPPQAAPAAATRVEHERLTAREMEVLALIANGDGNKLIARALDLSPHTVKRHVAHILDKLGLATRGQAAAWYHAEK